LVAIKGIATALRERDVAWEGAASEQMLETLTDEADRLNRLVGNLLDMSRIESGALQPSRAWEDIGDIIGGVLARFRPRFHERAVRLSIPEDLPLVWANAGLIDQVLTNLIENALNGAACDMTNARILVVDDEPQIRRFLKTTLEVRGYEVALAETGREALEQITGWRPDVVLLDLGLPIMDGLEVCRRVREWSDVPIIVLTVRDREEDKVVALNAGADDYLTKPFGAGELLARIQVVLRHAARLHLPHEPLIMAGELHINLALRQITRRGEAVHLTPAEYELLKTLATSGGRVLTHGMLLQKVWGPDQPPDPAKLRVFVNQLRRKIEDDPAQPRHIVTEPGVGYRFHID
jgi:two-component system, OmpR family, KDP operon response regulator KdpE